ncbi:MAG: hypothetical protein OEY59_03480 [Deltaproteobacteria bacterium]|nr:hypothetical protein [Deltaproteobacteria bacterium]
MERLILCLMMILFASVTYGENCGECHREEFPFSPYHDPKVIGCVSCHAEVEPKDKQNRLAHERYEAYPGRMKTLDRTCGKNGCHLEAAKNTRHSIMNRLEGMVRVTRDVFDETDPKAEVGFLLKSLSDHGADSYLRKLCVSCHLSGERKNHSQSIKDRGGGCSACHLKTDRKKLPQAKRNNQKKLTHKRLTGRHPVLTIKIESERCFGCHSRSARTALNYYGYAEAVKVDSKRVDDFGYLADNRLVEIKAKDLHKKAGMDCIDCHTMSGVMGDGQKARYQKDQIDIQCLDCHGLKASKKSRDSFSDAELRLMALTANLEPLMTKNTVVSTRKKKSPLFHVREKDGQRILRTKLGGQDRIISLIDATTHKGEMGHERLSCEACHSAWAPQCYGCHISFDPEISQWDHLKKRKTNGRWTEKKWHIVNDLPALGVNGNKITPFIPGMNLTIEQPGEKPLVKRLFSPVSPHTTRRKSRSCESCHKDDRSLGIIQNWIKAPFDDNLTTPDGWIDKNQKNPGNSIYPGARSFSQNEIKKIKMVGKCLDCHPETQRNLYLTFKKSLEKIAGSLHPAKQKANSKRGENLP